MPQIERSMRLAGDRLCVGSDGGQKFTTRVSLKKIDKISVVMRVVMSTKSESQNTTSKRK